MIRGEIMNRMDKARKIGQILDKYYPSPEVPLEHVDPFTLLVAVVLSAQTTDLVVNRVTPELFSVASDPEAMADVALSTIRRIIKPIGLAPTKAKNIKALSRLLVKRHAGRVPSTFEELEALPGVGHKSASVVMTQAFGIPAFPVDTHIHRLAARWGLSRGTNVVKTEQDLKKVFPIDEWNVRHLQIIYFGREYCPARGHDLSVCPICSWAATKKRIAQEAALNRSKRR